MPCRTAFLFPGQGAQVVGMAGALCQSFPAAKALFDRAASILGYDLLAVCVNGPAERLNATDVSQPAIFVASLAALEQLKVAEPKRFDRSRRDRRAEPRRVHRTRLRRRDDVRRRVEGRAGARAGDAGRRRRDAIRHGQRARLGDPRHRSARLGGASRRHTRDRELPLPRQHGPLGRDLPRSSESSSSRSTRAASARSGSRSPGRFTPI